MPQTKHRGRPKADFITPPVRPDFESLAVREPIPARSSSIFPGEIEISVPFRDQIVAYVQYLELHVDPKRLRPAPLSARQQQVVALEAQAWATAKRLAPSGYVPWKALKPYIPRDLYAGNSPDDKEDAFVRTLINWRGSPAYRAAFITLCAAALAAAVSRRDRKKNETK